MSTLNLPEKIALLHEAFKGLEDSELQEMAALTEFRTYPPDHLLCIEGAYENMFYIIAAGHVVISKKMLDEEGERVLRVSGRGDLVGEMALIQHTPRAATVRTTTVCTVLEMEKENFEALLGRSPRMANNIIRITLDRIRANDQMAIADLQKTNKILRQLDRNKLEFIQVTAHELRTPLTVLKGYLDVLNAFPETKANPAMQEVLAGLIRGSTRMHEVVNMMLDVTRIDAATVKIAPTPIVIKGLINDLVADLAPATAERHLNLHTTHAPQVPNIQGDPALIHKAIYHLLVNAIKYTPNNGRVDIQTRPLLRDNEVTGVEIVIQDTGIGLDPEHHELVFEKFYQVGSVALHSSSKTNFKGGGPGLGLAIVRGVARAHGGKVWVESPGCDEEKCPGSTFYLQLPIDPLMKATP